MPLLESESGRLSTTGVESIGRTFTSGEGPDAVDLYYELYGDIARAGDPSVEKALFLHGASFTGSDWNHQIEELMLPGADRKAATTPLVVCTIDNMGCGRSSHPKDKRVYQTTHMAHDVFMLMEHLGWARFHVVGFSLGAMIALKLAAKYPANIASLTLISVNSGGIGSLPGGLGTGWKVMTSGRNKNPVARAKADLALHFTPKHLRQWVPKKHKTVYDLLLAEYTEVAKLRGPHEGTNGQLYAMLSHKLRSGEKATILAAKFPTLFIHGMHDKVGSPKYAQTLAREMGAPIIMLDAAHMVTRECAVQVNTLLHNMLLETAGFSDKSPDRFILPMEFTETASTYSESSGIRTDVAPIGEDVRQSPVAEEVPQGGARGPQVGPQGQQFGAQGPQVGPQGQQFGAPGPQVGPQGPQVGAPGPQVGPQGPQVGAPGPQVGPNGPHVAPEGNGHTEAKPGLLGSIFGARKEAVPAS